MDAVGVLPAGARLGHVALVLELVDDPVRGPLGDAGGIAYLARGLPQAHRDGGQHAAVIGDERPFGQAGLLLSDGDMKAHTIVS